MKAFDETQKKINKAKRSGYLRTCFVGGAAVGYIIFAWKISLDESNPLADLLVLLSLGFGIGLFFVMFSIILHYETTKKLIEIEGKLNEINEKPSENSVKKSPIQESHFPRNSIIVLIVAFAALAFLALMNEEKIEKKLITIEADTIFDPLCKGEQKYEIYGACDRSGGYWVEQVGTSLSLQDKHPHIYDSGVNTEKILFLKIPIEIPHSNDFTNTVVTRADLRLITRYNQQPENEIEKENFILIGGICGNVNWSEQTMTKDLPCVDEENENSLAEHQMFFEIRRPDTISEVTLDLIPHVEYARNNNLKKFTEMITFTPTSYTNNDIEDSIIDCLEKNIADNSYGQNCLKKLELDVFTINYHSRYVGFHPILFLEYETTPTLLTSIFYQILLTGILVIIPVLLFLHFSKRQNGLHL